MENHLVSRNRFANPQASARDGHMKESRSLGYQLKSESTNVPHADIRSEMVNDANIFPSISSIKQQDNGIDRQNEELVRYMSNLPSFLKKDVKINEKAFSVGVLDWKLLENWQHFHNIGNQHSSAPSNLSSFSSTGGSSSHSSSCYSLSPAPQKLRRYPTLQSHFYGTPFQNCSNNTESSEVNELKAQDRKVVPNDFSGVQQSTFTTDLLSDQKVEYRVKECKAKEIKVVKHSMARKSQSLEDIREKMKNQDSESLRKHLMMRTSFDHHTTDEVHARGQETPRYELGNKHPQISRSLNLSDTKKIGSKKGTHLSFPNADNEASCTELFCNMPPSCPSREASPSHPHIEEPCPGASEHNNISHDLFRRFSDCGDVSVNMKGVNLQEEKSIQAVELLINPSMASNTKTGSWGTTKARNPSPTRRFSFSSSRVGKVSSSSAALTESQSSSRNRIGTSAAEEASTSSSSLNNSKANIKGRLSNSSSKNPIGIFGADEAGVPSSSFNNSKANRKGRSSPLKRLLEPLMRPARASLSDSRSNEPTSKSSEGHGESSVKLLDLKTCKNVEAEVPHGSSKHASPTVQALLQVAVRNGFPLFTFAVDNKNDILAATMRKSISGKEEFSCIYSFFIIHELKKRSGNWINHGRKDKGNNFVPNIVAQMKVTDSFRQNSLDQSISKEYVLFPSDTKQAETSAHELNDELAAVVVNIPKKSTGKWFQSFQGFENSNDSLTSKLKEAHSLSSFKCNSGSGNIRENQTDDQLSMTVLLPGGHHGQPIKGESSSLVKRWQSGGSCDCGGWDLGCRMRVLTDNAQSLQTSSSADKLLELFSQDEGQDQKPVFSLAPFKDGIYAVEFNSSIKILQAFSISLSILSCLNLVECVETSNRLKEKPSAVLSVSETGGKRIHAKPQTVVPAFISNPPPSPVGRV